MRLLFVGDSNWDLYLSDDNSTIWSISKDGNVKGNSCFGDKHHIKRLMDKYKGKAVDFIDSHQPTELALEHFSGMASHLITPERSEPFWLLRF